MKAVSEECYLADSDQRLVELARGGSRAAFEAIVLRYQMPLLRHCRRMLTPAEAEDAVQETFMAAFRTIGRTAPGLRLGGWLFRIAHNAALGILRRRTLTLPLEDVPTDKQSVHETALQRVQLEDTLAAISRLPSAEKHVLVERALAGRGHREIATTLGRSEGAVRQLLHRARTRLREGLAALAPLLVRFAPANGDQQLAGASLAAKGGLVLAVGVTAVSGGGALLSHELGGRLSHAAGARTGASLAASHGWTGAVSAPVARSAAHRWIVTTSPERTVARGGGQTTQHLAVSSPGQPTSTRSRPAVAARTVSRVRTGSTGSPVSAQTSTQTTAPTPPLVTQAPTQSVSTAGQTATAPGQAATQPDQSGTAPGRSAMAPGHSSAAPGPSTTAPGASAAAPGHSIMAPGHSSAPPGRRFAPPALGGGQTPRLAAPERRGPVEKGSRRR